MKKEKGDKYRDEFNNKRQETYHAQKKEIKEELKKCDIKAFKLGGDDAQVEHLPPPEFSSKKHNKETTETTLKMLKGLGKFLVDKYEETIQPLLEAMVKKEGTDAVVPDKPAVAIIDGGRWEIFIDNLKTNQSTKCWEYLLELYMDKSKEGQAFMKKQGKGKETLVKNKCIKFMEMVATYMKCCIEKNCTGYQGRGKNMKLSMRSLIFHPASVKSQKVHTDMHRDGIQFILQMYTGKAGEDKDYPIVATEEYKLPDGCLEESGKVMRVKKIAWEDLLSQWPGIEDDCHKELMDLINGQERKEDVKHVISVLQNHAVPLLLESDKTWEKLGGDDEVGKPPSRKGKKQKFVAGPLGEPVPEETLEPLPEKTLKTGGITALNGGIPHAGPACKVGRVVLFATAEPDEGKIKYDAYTQYCTTDVVVLLGKLVWNKTASRKLKKFMFLKLLDAAKRDPPRAIDQYAVGDWKDLSKWYTDMQKQNTMAQKMNNIKKMLDKMSKKHSEDKFTESKKKNSN